MKNLLRSTLYLAVFAFAGILFQISCSNTAEQSLSVNQTGKIVFTKWETSGQSIWTCNYDGSNPTQIPISLPANISFSNVNGNADAKLSPDGQKIFFNTIDSSGGAAGYTGIYSCDIDGTNLIPVVTSVVNTGVTIGSAN